MITLLIKCYLYYHTLQLSLTASTCIYRQTPPQTNKHIMSSRLGMNQTLASQTTASGSLRKRPAARVAPNGPSEALGRLLGLRLHCLRARHVPLLKAVACSVLAQPVSASAAEHNWSVYGRIMTPTRSRLHHARADKLVYCHEALHMKAKLQKAAYTQNALIRLRYTVTDTYRVVKSAGYTLNSSENEFKFMALQSWRVNSMNSYSTCRHAPPRTTTKLNCSIPVTITLELIVTITLILQDAVFVLMPRATRCRSGHSGCGRPTVRWAEESYAHYVSPQCRSAGAVHDPRAVSYTHLTLPTTPYV